MPNPISTAQLCAVPLNPNGLFTIGFGSAAARDSYFSGRAVYTLSSFVFIRKDNVIKVGINADVLDSSGVNYVVYTNPEYNGNRKFFAFIKYIEYAAPDTSILHIETDSFMTYQFELGTTQAFIERETVLVSDDNDTQTLSEPVEITGYHDRRVNDYNHKFPDSFGFGIVFGTLEYDENDINTDGKDAANQGVTSLGGAVFGGHLLCTNDANTVSLLVKALLRMGANIATIFTFPKNAIAVNQILQISITARQPYADPLTVNCYTPLALEGSFTLVATTDFNTSFQGYTPRNNKCNLYPYRMCYVTNNNGSEKIYKIERLGSGLKIDQYVGIPSAMVLWCDYEGRDGGVASYNMQDAITFNDMPSVAWSSNEYDLYLAQHRNTISYNMVKSMVDYGMNFASTGMQAGATGNAAGLVASAFGAFMDYKGRQAVFSDMKSIGETVHNLPSINTAGITKTVGFTVYDRKVLISDARRIDSFFDRFGYRVDRIGTVTWNKRPDYDYIKTQGVCFTGNIPMKDKAKINALFDAGITIWHNSSRYGLYADSSNTNR